MGDITRYRAKLDAGSLPIHIAVYGDSITDGSFAQGSTTGTAVELDAIHNTDAWVGQLRGHFAARYGDPGDGYRRAFNSSLWPKTGGTGTHNGSSLGAFREHIALDATGETAATTSHRACDTVVVHGWWNGTGQAFVYSLDSGADTTAPASSGTGTHYSFAITGLAATTHTITLKKPAGGTGYIRGVSFLNAGSHVAVHRVGKDGQVLKDLTYQYDANDANGNKSLDSATRIVHTTDGAADGYVDLAILAFSANNVTGGWTTHAQTPAMVAAGYGRVMDRLIAQGTDVLFLAGPQRDPTSYSIGYTQTEFDDAIRAEVATRTYAAALDIKDTWGTYADGNAAGYYYDTIHPNAVGHASMADIVYSAIGPDPLEVPMTPTLFFTGHAPVDVFDGSR